ncbi:MAG: carboxynorspermidine decarboxylase, partial [Planctomycetota bacterium]
MPDHPPLDVSVVPTPCYVVELSRLESNLRILRRVHDESGARILLALKGFATFSTADLCRQYLQGCTASSLWEARLASEEFRGEVHAYSPAYSEEDLREIAKISDHVVFNSLSQWNHLRPTLDAEVSCGLRVNPEVSGVDVEIYDPCAKGSRLGVAAAELEGAAPEGLDGLHYHAHCGQPFDALEKSLESFERLFGHLLPSLRWINLGGGQRITSEGYDVVGLIERIQRLRREYGVDVYLEPGEAVGRDTGVLVTTVLDIIEREGHQIALLDASVAAHMPDVLEMPYRPEIVGAGPPGERAHDYRLGGTTCLAGDIVGDYSFDEPLHVGSRIVLEDMAHYSMVK